MDMPPTTGPDLKGTQWRVEDATKLKSHLRSMTPYYQELWLSALHATLRGLAVHCSECAASADVLSSHARTLVQDAQRGLSTLQVEEAESYVE